jgi:2-polyprenyl-3-methyl-5-hydroxy-6-metoxy-1,4-benzoquinol methylase
MSMDNNLISNEVAEFYNMNTYPAMGVKGIYTYAKMKRHLFQELGLDFSYFSDKSILEAGCGTGESTLIYSYFKPKEIVGIDLAQKSIEMAKETSARLKIKAEFHTLDLNDISKLNREFDFIMCEVLHQTDSPIEGLKKLFSVLKPGGLIVVAVAHRYGNLFDPMKRKFIEAISGHDKEKIFRFVKKLFFNKHLLWTKARGVKKKDYLNLDNLIADIYIHPFRKNISNNEILNWLKEADLEFVSSYPAINFKDKQPNFFSKSIGNFKLLLGNEYHLSVLARKKG